MSAPGDLIASRYRLVTLIGRGGMGVVWQARDERLGRPVAIKLLHRQHGLTPAETALANERAMREARITARIHHAHAVPVFDVVEHDGQPCLVMQYVPSVPLSALLRETGPLTPSETAKVGAEVASALAAAHAAEVVHRDIKPANILIADDDTTMISDFGISRAFGDATLTATGLMTGTPAYLSPEVARGADSTTASDVFSLGSTLYAAVEGAPPFGTDPNMIALLHRVASGQVTPPASAGPLTEPLMAMLATDPAKRPTMAEVAERFTTVRRRLAASSALPTPPAAFIPTAGAPPAGAAPTPAAAPTPVPVPTPAVADRPAPSRSADDTTDRRLPPVPPPNDPPAPRRRQPAVLAAILAAVVLITVIAVGVHRAGTVATAPPTTAVTASAAPSATSTPTKTPSTSASSSATQAPSATSTTPTTTQLAAAITDYYLLVPGDTDAGWKRLSDSYQVSPSGGRRAYEQFWSAIKSVRVSDVSAKAPDQVTATLSYVYRDGRTSTERTTFTLVADDGFLKINRSRVGG